ncbi:hypothetical protein, partial [Sediminitomix flava]|uniref:hypothetical protein n=1 Tax=Sediminitomix flava TaxID=379075 RepID=UPI001304B514
SADSLFACSDGQIQVSPTELANDSLIYIWSVGTVVSDQGDNLAIQHNGLNSYQFSSSFVNATFSGQATVAYAKVGLDVQNTSLTSCLDTDSVVLTYFRIPKVEAKATPMAACAEGVEFTLDEDSIGNFNYYWKQESVTGGTVTALGDSSDWNFEVLASSFDSGSYQIELTYSVLVENNNSTSCSETDTITYIIERAPHIDLFVSAHNCEDDISLNAINAEGITGFEYSWTKLTETGGAVTNSDTTSANLNVMLDRFDNTAHKLEADYEVRVSNPDLVLCDEVSDTTVVFYRTPSVAFAVDSLFSCADSSLVASVQEDSIGGFDYTWRQISIQSDQSVVSQQINQNPLSDYALQTTFANVDFPSDAARMIFGYELSVENAESTSCANLDTINFVYYRIPDFDLTVTRAGNDSCASMATFQADEAQVSGFNYQWRLLNTIGGAVSVVNNLTDYNLDVALDSFAVGSSEVEVEVELIVGNSFTTSCTQRDTLSVIFYRTPDLVLNLDQTACSEDFVLNITEESVGGFNYEWDVTNVLGGSVSYSNILDDSLAVSVDSFANGSSFIDVSVELDVENANSTSCQDTTS